MCQDAIFLFCVHRCCFWWFSFSFVLLFLSLVLAWRKMSYACLGICGTGNKHPNFSATIWMLILHFSSQENRPRVNIIVFGPQLWLPKCDFYHWHFCQLLWVITVQRIDPLSVIFFSFLFWASLEKDCEMIYSSVHEKLHVFSGAEFWPLILCVLRLIH